MTHTSKKQALLAWLCCARTPKEGTPHWHHPPPACMSEKPLKEAFQGHVSRGEWGDHQPQEGTNKLHPNSSVCFWFLISFLETQEHAHLCVLYHCIMRQHFPGERRFGMLSVVFGVRDSTANPIPALIRFSRDAPLLLPDPASAADQCHDPQVGLALHRAERVFTTTPHPFPQPSILK